MTDESQFLGVFDDALVVCTSAAVNQLTTHVNLHLIDHQHCRDDASGTSLITEI